MSPLVKGTLTVLSSALITPLVLIVVDLAIGEPVGAATLAGIGVALGLAYGLEAAILGSYDLSLPKGWLLLVDLTWSLPNTLFGLVLGNLIYPFFGVPSRALSQGEGWVAFRSRGFAFGTRVLQTLGTINLGGRGAHEMVHVVQARILGPLFLPLQAVNYTVNFLAQVLFTSTLGALLAVIGVRDKAYLRPPSRSAVSGFWGWIYYATLMELWAYGTEP